MPRPDNSFGSRATGSPIDASPAVANGGVYVAPYDSHLYAFDAAKGRVIWRATAGFPLVSSPAIAN
jgi:outer membrane protein assembly factor BamB